MSTGGDARCLDPQVCNFPDGRCVEPSRCNFPAARMARRLTNEEILEAIGPVEVSFDSRNHEPDDLGGWTVAALIDVRDPIIHTHDRTFTAALNGLARMVAQGGFGETSVRARLLFDPRQG